jgi:hypothetical protein
MHLRDRIVCTAHRVRLPWSDDGGGQIAYHLARAVRAEGMKLALQLWYGGAVRVNSIGGPSSSATTVPNPGKARYMTETGQAEAFEAGALDGARWSSSGKRLP